MLVLQLASPIGLLQIGPSSHPLAPSRPMRQGDHLVDDPPDSRLLVEFVIGHLMFALLHARWTMRVSRTWVCRCLDARRCCRNAPGNCRRADRIMQRKIIDPLCLRWVKGVASGQAWPCPQVPRLRTFEPQGMIDKKGHEWTSPYLPGKSHPELPAGAYRGSANFKGSEVAMITLRSATI
jgi:hypothetical protein